MALWISVSQQSTPIEWSFETRRREWSQVDTFVSALDTKNTEKEIVMLDKVVSKIAALGVPGLVLVVAMGVSGWVGGAAVVAALAMLGGPLGMLGGVAVLVILALISNALAKYGFEMVFEATVARLREKGVSDEEIIRKVDGYPISKEIKLKLKDSLKNCSKRS